MKLNRTFAQPRRTCRRRLPLFPVAGALLLPRRPIQLTVFEPRYLVVLDDALSGERLIGMIQPKAGDDAVGPAPELCEIGCVGRIVQYAEIGDGRCFLSLMGVARFRVGRGTDDVDALSHGCAPDYAPLRAGFRRRRGRGPTSTARRCSRRCAISPRPTTSRSTGTTSAKASNETLVNSLAIMSPYGAREKQAMLEAPDLESRGRTSWSPSRSSISPAARVAPRNLTDGARRLAARMRIVVAQPKLGRIARPLLSAARLR